MLFSLQQLLRTFRNWSKLKVSIDDLLSSTLFFSRYYYLESSKYCSLGHEPSQLVCFQNTNSILNVLDDLFSRLFQTKVQISAPETTIVAVKYLVTLFQWKKFGKIEHGRDLLQVLDPVLDVFLMSCQVGVDEQEGGSEENESYRHCSFGLELSSRSGAEAVIFRNTAIPNQISPADCVEMNFSNFAFK